MDKVTLQVFANHARAVAENMAYTLYRTAHSTFVKETEDFTVQILEPGGNVAAVPMDFGATWYPGIDYSRAIAMIDHYEPGDIGFTNDPYSGFLATHVPDLHMWKPIFEGGEILAWAGGHIHNTDMGGAVPASLSRALLDVQRGYVSAVAAERDYAVVIHDGALDAAATAALRAARRATVAAHFDFGPERLAHEAIWTAGAYDAMTEIMSTLPTHWRFFVRQRLFAMLPTPAADGAAAVRDAFAQLRAAYPGLAA